MESTRAMEGITMRRLKDMKGVTLLEMAVALFILTIGLLGLAVFLGVAHLPRSAPLVGGLTLALMTLPTIIIAGRAAIVAVPPSIREAALGMGASRMQMISHHVLPLAMPGMLTGTIIGMAQALGETAESGLPDSQGVANGALGVEVHQNRAAVLLRQRHGQIESNGGFSHAPLLAQYHDTL